MTTAMPTHAARTTAADDNYFDENRDDGGDRRPRCPPWAAALAGPVHTDCLPGHRCAAKRPPPSHHQRRPYGSFPGQPCRWATGRTADGASASARCPNGQPEARRPRARQYAWSEMRSADAQEATR